MIATWRQNTLIVCFDIPTTDGSRSMKRERGTILPVLVSQKNGSKEDSSLRERKRIVRNENQSLT